MQKHAAKREGASTPPIADTKGASEEPAPPPAEMLEPDADLSSEEIEQARKDYLLTRFWISARGFWSRNGHRLAWPFSIGLLTLIVGNVALQTKTVLVAWPLGAVAAFAALVASRVDEID